MSVIGLPVNLGVVADVADKAGVGGRFGLGAVEVTVTDASYDEGPGPGKEGPPLRVMRSNYRVAATDTKRLIVVEGECVDTADVDRLQAVRTAPNSATRAMVRAKEFKKVFADAAKHTKAFMAPKLVMASLSAECATFGSTDRETDQVTQTLTCTERFPPVGDILKDARKKAPVAKFAIDPKYLAELAKIAAGFADPESMRMDISFEGEDKPVLMTATNGGQKLTMLLMPLSC